MKSRVLGIDGEYYEEIIDIDDLLAKAQSYLITKGVVSQYTWPLSPHVPSRHPGLWYGGDREKQ